MEHQVLHDPDVAMNSRPLDSLRTAISDCSKITSRVFVTYFGLLSYGIVATFGTKDRQIALNESIHLPLAGVSIPLNAFFIVFPLLLCFSYVYFQLYLHRLQRLKYDYRLRTSQAGSPDLHPWMLNIAEDPDYGLIGRMQQLFIGFSVWWSLPIVISVIVLWYLKKHDPLLSFVLPVLPLLTTAMVLWFYKRYSDAKKIYGSVERKHRYPLFPRSRGVWIGLGAATVVVLFLVTVAISARQGRYHFLLGSFPVLDLSYQSLVTKPEVDYEGLFWGKFYSRHLQGINLTNSVAIRMDLRDAELQNAKLELMIGDSADIRRTNLRNADLSGAFLRFARFDSSCLAGAVLTHARLDQVTFLGADLDSSICQGSRFHSANMKGSSLRFADCSAADFSGASLDSSDLTGARFSGANLSQASLLGCRIDSTVFPSVKLTGAKIPWKMLLLIASDSIAFDGNDWQGAQLHGAKFRACTFGNTNFSGADLRRADLSRAIFSGGNLNRARLDSADLSHASFSSVDLTYAAATNANFKMVTFTSSSLRGANLHAAQMDSLDFPGGTFVDADLSNAVMTHGNFGSVHFDRSDLRNADLSQCYLVDAVFSQAEMANAKFDSANLGQTQLQNARGLSVQQLKSARTLFGATMDAKLADEIRKCCPELLVEPKIYPWAR